MHELRARRLCATLQADITFYNVDRSLSLRHAMMATWQVLRSQEWDLVYQESTGLAGGLASIRAAVARRQPFVVSSGDPIAGFFRVTKGPLFGSAFRLYEQALYRTCAGFVGWTPYLTGRALELGARRGVTVEGAVDLDRFRPLSPPARALARARFGLPRDLLVCGVVGSLRWTPRQSYCYGLELVQALTYLRRPDVSVLIVGDGSGLARLQAMVPEHLKARVIFTGRLPEDEVVTAINAMDIGFITQTLDALGSYRLTTKLPEYLACGLPVAMSPVPGYYDYVARAGWSLPPEHPADVQFHQRCARWLDGLTLDEVCAKAACARQVAARYFDYNVVRPKFEAFVSDIIGESRRRRLQRAVMEEA